MAMVKSVSSQLMNSSIEKYAMMSIGFLKSMSSDDIIEFSISPTSPVILAMMSPLRSSVKKPSGSDVIFLYSWLRMSRTMPVRMGIIDAELKK